MKNKTKQKLKIFFTHKCKIKFNKVKQAIKKFNGGNTNIYHIGDVYSLLELSRFAPDIVIQDFDSKDIYVLKNDFFKLKNPF